MQNIPTLSVVSYPQCLGNMFLIFIQFWVSPDFKLTNLIITPLVSWGDSHPTTKDCGVCANRFKATHFCNFGLIISQDGEILTM